MNFLNHIGHLNPGQESQAASRQKVSELRLLGGGLGISFGAVRAD